MLNRNISFNVSSREIQLYCEYSLALSLIAREPAFCLFLGLQTTNDLSIESSTERILKTSTGTNITTTSSSAYSDYFSDDPHATAASVLRLIIIGRLLQIGYLALWCLRGGLGFYLDSDFY